MATRFRRGKSRDVTWRRRLISERGERCQWCGRVRCLELHHIQPVAKNGDWTRDNLLILCMVCHVRAHGHTPKRLVTDPWWLRLLGPAGGEC